MNNKSSVSIRLKPCYCLSRYCTNGSDCSEVIQRRGPMCGLCEHNHSLPAYYYNFTCVDCSNYQMNWLKYIAVAYLPLTGFYFLVLALKLSATTGSLNALVTIIQLAAAPGIVRFYSIRNHAEWNAFVNMIIGTLSVLNLDFFKSYYHPFCLHPSMTTIQVFSLEYLVGVYPLLLVAITYFLVKLHDRYSIVVSLWRPCYRVISCFSSKLNIKTSLVQAFATFFLLSYVKICNVSFDILTPAKKYLRPDGSEVDKQYWYYNGSLEFFGKDHIPYSALAIVMSLLFNILPLLLLILYPFYFFRKLLHFLKLECTLLNIFMDTFYGPYRKESRYYSLFATVYIILRIINLLLFVAGAIIYFMYAAYLFVLVLVVVAIIRPYRKWSQNFVDIALLLCILTHYLFKNSLYEVAFITSGESKLRLVSQIIVNILSLLFPAFYSLLVISSLIIPRCCVVKCKEKVYGWLHNKELEESLPHRLNECSPLIK